MRVAIDISPILYGTGVSVYTKNLVKNLLILDSGVQFTLFGGSLRSFSKFRSIVSENFKEGSYVSKLYPFPPVLLDLLWNRLHIFDITNLVGNVDVVHTSDWTQPPTKAFKVTTIHDLSPLIIPEFTHSQIVKVHKRRLRWVYKEVDRIIVPSQTTANDLIKLGFQNEKIKIIGEAPDPEFKKSNEADIKFVKSKFGIKGNYLVSVGVNKRKNTKRIIEAFEKVRQLTDVKLVIVGFSREKVKSEEDVIFTGHIGQKLLVDLLSGAQALVYPSLYEGYGLPILEAYKCGIPVVTSNIGSMKEVSAGASVLVDPYDVNSIKKGILTAMENRKLYIEKGDEVVKEFSWKKVAKKTLQVYNSFEKSPSVR